MTGDLESEKATVSTKLLSRSKSAASHSRLPLATSRVYNSAKVEDAKPLSKIPSSKLQENREVKRFCNRSSIISKEIPRPVFAVQRSKSMLEPRTPIHRLRPQSHANSALRRSPSARSATLVSKGTRAHFTGQLRGALDQHSEDSKVKKLPSCLSAPISDDVADNQGSKGSLAPLGTRGITPWPRARTKKRVRSPLVPVELRSENELEGESKESDGSTIFKDFGRRLSLNTPVKKSRTGRTRTDCLKLEALSGPRDDLFPNAMSVGSLPSQVIQHTPPKHKELMDALGLNPTLPAKKRTLWTMLDEIRLVRSDGLLSDAEALDPLENARVIPLCQRRCNGMVTSDSPLVRRWTSLGTPVKSTLSLKVDSPTRSSSRPSNCAFENGSPELVAEEPILSIEEKTSTASYQWSLVSVKWKPIEDHQSPKTRFSTHKFLKPTQPSLLTRAHTLVRLIGARKTSGLT